MYNISTVYTSKKIACELLKDENRNNGPNKVCGHRKSTELKKIKLITASSSYRSGHNMVLKKTHL